MVASLKTVASKDTLFTLWASIFKVYRDVKWDIFIGITLKLEPLNYGIVEHATFIGNRPKFFNKYKGTTSMEKYLLELGLG